MTTTFLNAEWRKLAMANYAIDPSILAPYLPYGTELDFWKDTCYVSLIGFMFLDTRVAGFKIPFHINFEEVNLRFYVKHQQNGMWKRGVVFIKEIVPKRALSFVANTLYNEKYVTMPMSHSWQLQQDKWDITYEWGKGLANTLQVIAEKQAYPIAVGSEEEFITEHYWGYTKISQKKTAEYEVEHPRWDVYKTVDYAITVDFENVYGTAFKHLQQEKPVSVFLAEGSPIKVKKGTTI
ncbi:MAG: DUF2071 domain-containing protein [Taibaiella sp.]|jgi:hypothetical protein